MKRMLIILFCFVGTSLFANQDTTINKIKVGVKETPPFIVKNETGNGFHGISIDLWNEIKDSEGIISEFVEYDFDGLLKAIENNEVDVCISPFTVTSSRLEKFDFTQPFYISNLVISVPKTNEDTVLAYIKGFFSIGFLRVIALLFFIVLIFGFLIWIVERKKNDQFAEGAKGIGNGIWWSAVTMTTVGYGDKVPKTFFGRFIGVIWMFTAVVVISSFTASIAASLTVDKIGSAIEGVDDLKRFRVGTIKSSSSAYFLDSRNIRYYEYESVKAGLEAVSENRMDAFVYDEPMIRYTIRKSKLEHKIHILPINFNAQYYSFSLPHNHPMYNQINKAIMMQLEGKEDDKWSDILLRYDLEK